MSELSIFDAIHYCSYNDQSKNLIIDKLLLLNEKDNNHQLYLRKYHDNMYFFIIKEFIIPFNKTNSSYGIKVGFHLLHDYPYSSPEVYLIFDRSILYNQLQVNLKSQEINSVNYQVRTYSLLFYSEQKELKSIFDEIENAFKQNFPIYINKNHINKNIPSDMCYFQIDSNTTKVNYLEEPKIKNYIEYSSPIIKNNKENDKPSLSHGVLNILNDEETKTILKNEIIFNLKAKYKEKLTKKLEESSFLNQAIKNLTIEKAYKNNFFQQKINFIQIIDKSLFSINSYAKELHHYITNNKLIIDEDFSINVIEKALKINDFSKKIINLVSVEATCEDILTIVKKLFEKKIISFNFAIKMNRNITKEFLKIKFNRQLIEHKKSISHNSF